MAALGLCVGCGRHARVGVACPFCGAEIAEVRERSAIARSSRAALLALVAVAPGALADCRRTSVTMYGGPPGPRPTMTASASATADVEPTNVPEAAPPDATRTMATPMYGMPPPRHPH